MKILCLITSAAIGGLMGYCFGWWGILIAVPVGVVFGFLSLAAD